MSGVLASLDRCRASMMVDHGGRCSVPMSCVAEAVLRYVLEGGVRGEAIKLSSSFLRHAMRTALGISGRCVDTVIGRAKSRLVNCAKSMLSGDYIVVGGDIVVKKWDLVKLVDCLVIGGDYEE